MKWLLEIVKIVFDWYTLNEMALWTGARSILPLDEMQHLTISNSSFYEFKLSITSTTKKQMNRTIIVISHNDYNKESSKFIFLLYISIFLLRLKYFKIQYKNIFLPYIPS